MKKALICGISGQDGSYLADLLLGKGYEVYGTSRDAQTASFYNLAKLGIGDRIKLSSMVVTDFRSVLQTLKKVQPDEVYNLAGQSSVGLSFEQPVDTMESITIGTLNLLEAIRFTEKPIRFYNAGSSECFGDTGRNRADETTPFRPRSPYAVAKAAAFWEVANYREAYNLFACTGVLFNHESSLRPERFVTKKIVVSASRIASGNLDKMYLGNIAIERDWGWAPEYVKAMWLMLQQEQADDFVIATGETRKLEDFVKIVFELVGLDWHNHVVVDAGLFRPTDLLSGQANPCKALEKLGWYAKYKMDDVARFMVEEERYKYRKNIVV
ncbi:GDP-mannose 4,6-dehydratase [Gammaproteobacteria bacterium]